MLKEGKSMKMMLRLAILMATLLLLAGVAFAINGEDCYYYETFYINLDNPSETENDYCWQLCFKHGEPSGNYSPFCMGDGDLVLFFDSMNEKALLYTTSINGEEVGYLKFHGDRLFIFNGIISCGEGNRYEVKGHRVNECTSTW
jgi:hypothetical protein